MKCEHLMPINNIIYYLISTFTKSNWVDHYVTVSCSSYFLPPRCPQVLPSFILIRAKLRWKISTMPKDGSDIHKFLPARYTDRNLWIWQVSLSQLENFQCSLVLPNLKNNHAVLFLKDMYWLFIYASIIHCFLLCWSIFPSCVVWINHKWWLYYIIIIVKMPQLFWTQFCALRHRT